MQILRRLDGARIDILEETSYRFRLPRQDAMRVPGGR
jgi:hypothetical protein